VKSKELWATHTQHLNDRQEFLHAIAIAREEINSALIAAGTDDEKKKLISRMQDAVSNNAVADINVCVASFSEAPDSLAQWRAYGGNGGFCLGFSSAYLQSLIERQEGFVLTPCIYDPDQQRNLMRAQVDSLIDKFTDLDAANRIPMTYIRTLAMLLKWAPRMKHPSFVEELEWRIITPPLPTKDNVDFDFRVGDTMPTPFYRFALRADGIAFQIEEVMVGPTSHPDRSAESTRSFLLSQGLEPLIINSNVPYRHW